MAEEKKDEITNAIDFLEKITTEDIVLIKFKKKDGSDRIMKATLNFARIPKADKPKGVSLKDILHFIKAHKILRVYDLEKMGWRSIPFDRTEWIRTGDQKVYSIRQVKDIFKK